MRTPVCIIIGLFFSSFILQAQKISNVDYDDVKSKTQLAGSPYLYSKLLDRYKKNDTTLSTKDYYYLYYGFTFSNNYDPNNDEAVNALVVSEIEKLNSSKALKNALQLYDKDPVNLKLLLYISVCYSNLSDVKMKKIFTDKYAKIIKAIYNSGDGKSLETAYVVIRINDEYQLLQVLNLTVKKHALVNTT
ncbi:MAG: DUF4919 domain-containing protein, partial [Cytophagales bacterium]|nr:DUF4919 domain-containing protein [Cytophaga sp.]